VVAEHLINALSTVFGEKATAEVLGAWGEAYWFLANLLIAKEAELTEKRAKQDGGWRGFKELKVVKKEAESKEVISFTLQRKDGVKCPDFAPGQYLTVKVKGDAEYDHMRNYSLSCAPGVGMLRISVKRDGTVSKRLHDDVRVGDDVLAAIPCGHFTLTPSEAFADGRRVCLISAGVGFTPLLAMLEALAADNDGGQQLDVDFVQCVRGRKDHAAAERVNALAGKRGRVKINAWAFYSRDSVDEGGDLATVKLKQGRIRKEDLKEIVGDAKKTRFFLCGPVAFMREVNRMLQESDVNAEQISYESFGPLEGI